MGPPEDAASALTLVPSERRGDGVRLAVSQVGAVGVQPLVGNVVWSGLLGSLSPSLRKVV